MRPLCECCVLHCGHRVHEASHVATIVERSQQDAPALHRDDEDGWRDDVFGVSVGPHLLLEFRYLTALFEAGQQTNQHRITSKLEDASRESRFANRELRTREPLAASR